jgi:lipoyl(octanoyl) transferase
MDERQRSELWICELGLVPYAEALARQQQLCRRRQREEVPDVLLLLEHPPVYTRGRRSRAQELPLAEEAYLARGVEVLDSDRGGRVTYHGPGQLVGYAIMRIADVHSYLRTIEAAIIAALAGEGIAARSRAAEGPDYTGVWVCERKIASIGVHVSRGVTTHGFAINVDNALEPFEWVIACGLQGVAMTSVQRELAAARTPDAPRFRASVAAHFCAAHGRQGLRVPRACLGVEELVA